mgnify:CR=1 FL=1
MFHRMQLMLLKTAGRAKSSVSRFVIHLASNHPWVHHDAGLCALTAERSHNRALIPESPVIQTPEGRVCVDPAQDEIQTGLPSMN